MMVYYMTVGLFLRCAFVGLLGGLLSRALLPDTLEFLVGFLDTQRPIRSLGAIIIGDRADFNLGSGLLNGHELTLQLGGHGQLLLLGLAFLRLRGILREDYELGLELLEPLDVILHGVQGAVLPAWVDSDADGGRVAHGNAGLLELLEREAAAQTHVHVVLVRRAAHDGAQKPVDRARSRLGVLEHARRTATTLAHRLLEPRAHAQLPFLAEMVIRDHIVVLHRALREGARREEGVGSNKMLRAGEGC